MSKYTVRSIQEIKEQAEILGMPLEKMHFYVGEDSKSPKCFGIYKDAQGNTVVYKNKSDGSRSVRYRGKDEAEAAQIFWDKLEDEIRIRQKNRDWWRHQEDLAASDEYGREYQKEIRRRKNREKTAKAAKTLPIALAGTAAVALLAIGGYRLIQNYNYNHPDNGYYTHDSEVYYYQSPNWYMWDTDTWDVYDDVSADEWHDWDYSSQASSEMSTDAYFTEFEDSGYYVEPSSSSSSSSDYDYDDDWSSDWDDSWDSSDDYDYDYDDWDYSDTDWDSDW